MKTAVPGLVSCLLFLATMAAEETGRSANKSSADDFRHGAGQWVVEQQPGGSVAITQGVLHIDDQGGCTAWFRPCLEAPVVISYEARVLGSGRVSDLNCFWQASDPAHPDDLFARGRVRDGRFASYDALRTYYVGYGGNNNTTTRFRRYDGTGARPLAPGNDRSGPAFLLKPDHTYRIQLVATAEGRVQFWRDGELVFDFHDPAPLRRGWFGLRTVHSRIEVEDFHVSEGEAAVKALALRPNRPGPAGAGG